MAEFEALDGMDSSSRATLNGFFYNGAFSTSIFSSSCWGTKYLEEIGCEANLGVSEEPLVDTGALDDRAPLSKIGDFLVTLKADPKLGLVPPSRERVALPYQ